MAPFTVLPLFLTFSDVSEEDLAKMAVAKTRREIKNVLKKCMNIDQSPGFRTEILVDFHYHNYAFCMSRQLCPQKVSTFLSAMRVVLEESISQRLTVDGAFDVLKECLLKHGVERPPHSVGVFPFEDVKVLLEYAHQTLFRHYRLYMYVYSPQSDLDFWVANADVCCPLPLPRLPPLLSEDAVDPQTVPELAVYFPPSPVPSESSLVHEPAARVPAEDRAAVIKRKIEEGTKVLMEKFEIKLNDQDARFAAALSK